MRNIMLALALIIVAAIISDRVDAAAKVTRAAARAECVKLAALKNFGRRAIQRRNFLHDCMSDRGFQ
jgi:hypothetical protein